MAAMAGLLRYAPFVALLLVGGATASAGVLADEAADVVGGGHDAGRGARNRRRLHREALDSDGHEHVGARHNRRCRGRRRGHGG